MAYEISTADGHYDFFTKIRTFVESTLPVAQQYTVLRAVTTGTDWEIIWKTPGAGGEEIFFGIKTYQSISSDYYNFKLGAFTGYVSSSAFEAQPGANLKGVPLINNGNTISYWLVADGNYLSFCAKIETVYCHGIVGKFLPYNTPYQYPYPMLCGGMLATPTNTRYSDVSISAWFKNGTTLSLRPIDGVWLNPTNYPQAGTKIIRNTIGDSDIAEGYYGIHSQVLSRATPDIFGEVPNIFFVSGFNNVVENTFTLATVPYVVLRDGANTGFKDYVAYRLI